MPATLPEIRIHAAERKLEITWPDGARHRFHYVWLRHAGRCADGMPNDTRIKIDLLPDEPAQLQILGCACEAGELVVDWADDGLQTRHGLDYLRHAAYDAEARRARKHQPTLWNRDSASRIPCFRQAELQDRERQLELLLAVRDFGLARVTDVTDIRGVADCFGPIHVNNYGEIFDVRSDAHKSLGSNTGHYLPPHSDESYRHEAPGISLFHCVEAAPEGGESILVDGFEAARLLNEQAPESYRVLTRVPLFFQRFAPPLEDMRSHTRVLVTDVDGDLVGMRWTDRTLPPQDLPDEHVEPVYRALRALWKIINDEPQQFRYRMAPGDLHVFDNHRVLHGRLAFDPGQGARHLRQCSINRDEFHNRLRCLAREQGNPAADLVMAGGAVG